jgi:Ca2+-transporting ATPase
VPLVFGPDTLYIDKPSASMTMCFVVVGLGTVFSGLVMRRDPSSGLAAPVLGAIKILVIPVGLLILSTELAFLQKGLQTQSLDGLQWLACVGLALVLPIVVEIDKWLKRRRLPVAAPPKTLDVVNPARATSPATA